MDYSKGQKLMHEKIGICYYFGKTIRGEAIIELYEKGKFIDRLPVNFSYLSSIEN